MSLEGAVGTFSSAIDTEPLVEADRNRGRIQDAKYNTVCVTYIARPGVEAEEEEREKSILREEMCSFHTTTRKKGLGLAASHDGSSITTLY